MNSEHIIYIESIEIIIQPKTIINEYGDEYIIYNWENADSAMIDYSNLTDNKTIHRTKAEGDF